MAKSQTEKAHSHTRIVESASVRFRQHGIDGVGVADLMKGVGMTHGGFYRHFARATTLWPKRSNVPLKKEEACSSEWPHRSSRRGRRSASLSMGI